MTFVELMIALVLSLILIGAVIQLYLSSKMSFRLHSAIAELQENGRMGIQFIADEVRTAGEVLGCRSQIVFTDVINGDGSIKETIPDADDFPDPVVQGYTQGDTLPAGFNGTPDTGTDILMFYRAGTAYDLASAMTEISGTNGLSIDPLSVDTDDIEICSSADSSTCIEADTDDWLLISDYARCALFKATNIPPGSPLTVEHDSTGNQTDRLYDFGDAPPAQVAAYERTFIYVQGGSLRIKRCTTTACANASSLVDGVANLQIDYGEDTGAFPDGSANRYVPSANVSNWRRVVSVRVHLLLRSLEDHVTQQTQGYTYNGAPQTAVDRRLYQPFTITIAIRNPL